MVAPPAAAHRAPSRRNSRPVRIPPFLPPPGIPRPAAAGAEPVDTTPWPLALARGTAATLLVVVAMLTLWSVLPALLGWRTQVVLTGSMQPRIEPGDLVLAAPVRNGDLQPGRIVLFRDPAHPGRTLVHRLVRFDVNGDMVTKGDANRSEDSTPTAPGAALGIPRLRVPWIGRPVVWLHEHDLAKLLVTAALLTALAALMVPTTPCPAPRRAAHRHPSGRV